MKVENQQEKRELICIGCPMGCNLVVQLEGGVVQSVSGNTCAKGDIYARKEVTSPTRIVTSTVRVAGKAARRVSVKTASDIPKDRIFDVMREIDRAEAKAPLKIGDVIIRGVAGTDADVVATKNVA